MIRFSFNWLWFSSKSCYFCLSCLFGLTFNVYATEAVTSADFKDVAIVANSDVTVDNLSLTELRKILLGNRKFWPNGQRVILGACPRIGEQERAREKKEEILY